MTPWKPRECKQCGSMFTPVRPMAYICSSVCAGRYVRAEKAAKKAAGKAAKEADRAKRESLKTIPRLIKEAQIEFNAYIRLRDAGKPCISCGRPEGDLSGLHAGRDAGHYRSTGSASHLRFDERNCHAQCVHCNQHLAGNVVQYRIGLVALLGAAAVEQLESDNEPVKWDRDTLRQIKVIYRAKARQLTKERA